MSLKKTLSSVLLSTLFLPVTAVVLSSCSVEPNRSKYAITAEYFAEEKKLVAEMGFTFINDTDTTFSTLEFMLYPNAYREGAKYEPVSSVYRAAAYYNGDSYGEITVDEVKDCASWELGGEDKNVLLVTLSKEVYPDEEYTLTISYTLTMPEVNHRFGVTEKAVNLANFYPVLCVKEKTGFYECLYYQEGDPFYSACADYSVTFTAPTEYTVASSGTGEKTVKGDKTTWEFCLENARDFALCLSKDFSVLSEKVGSTTVNYYYYDDSRAEENLNIATKALKYFKDSFGEYIYPTYSVCQTGFCYGGMEYPALVLISDKLKADDYGYTVVHETAHQWWYAMVGNNECEYAWMDEGLTEYSTALFYGAHPEYNTSREDVVNASLASYKAYCAIYKQIFGENDLSMSRNLSAFISEYEYVNLTYHKGVMLFDALRSGIGEEKFFSSLKNYYKTYLGKIATPDDMIECFKKTGVDVGGLFESFLKGKES